MKRKYDEAHTSSFIKGLTILTGLSQRKLQKYASENNLFNVLEHPNIIEPNKQQLEKINMLNEFISSYRFLKFQETENKLALTSVAASGEFFMALMGGIKDKEKFMVAFLDNSNNIIETRTMSEGSIGEVIVYPRNILKVALDCDCRSIILAHNHPSGNLSPSKQDIDITKMMVSIFAPLQIKVLDHIIVASTNYCSMLEQGNLPSPSDLKVSYEAFRLENQEAKEKVEGYIQSSNEYQAGCNDYDLESEEEDEWEI